MNFDEEEYHEFGEQGDEEGMEIEHQRVDQMPVMIKGKELFEIVSSIVDTLPEENDLYFLKEQMLTDAAIIPAKIAGAEGVESYTTRMENAVLIKLAARALVNHTYTCRMFNISEERYLELLRATVEEFRLEFIDWVNTFDNGNDGVDEWGHLFR